MAWVHLPVSRNFKPLYVPRVDMPFRVRLWFREAKFDTTDIANLTGYPERSIENWLHCSKEAA
jgi:hypothetical protein